MGGLWVEFDRRIKNILKMTNGRRIVLWGYGFSGKFISHYFRRMNRIIDVIIDDKVNYPSEMHVFQSVILDELSADDCFVICDFQEETEVNLRLQKYGYIEGITYVWLRKCLGKGYDSKVSYYDWLDYAYGTDISAMVDNAVGDNLFYSYGCDYALVDVLDNLCLEGENMFDFGYGKAGALIMFAQNGAAKIGGVEYDKRLCDIARLNLEKCNIGNCELFNMDAAMITTEIDDYSIFNMYNPFGGETFRKVITNIEASYTRNPRRIILIYSGVVLHKEVIRNGRFRLVRKIYNDFWSKYTNIYVMDGTQNDQV